METQTVEVPKKWSEKVRSMQVNDTLDITEKGRTNSMNQAKLAFREASFVTRQLLDRIYLIRTA